MVTFEMWDKKVKGPDYQIRLMLDLVHDLLACL